MCSAHKYASWAYAYVYTDISDRKQSRPIKVNIEMCACCLRIVYCVLCATRVHLNYARFAYVNIDSLAVTGQLFIILIMLLFVHTIVRAIAFILNK